MYWNGNSFVVVTEMDRVIVVREALCGESALGAINGMLASSSASLSYPFTPGPFMECPTATSTINDMYCTVLGDTHGDFLRRATLIGWTNIRKGSRRGG